MSDFAIDVRGLTKKYGERTVVVAGFSRKPMISLLCATSTTPNRDTSSGDTGSVARVHSALVSRWYSSIRL